jgi:hypothetical protein
MNFPVLLYLAESFGLKHLLAQQSSQLHLMSRAPWTLPVPSSLLARANILWSNTSELCWNAWRLRRKLSREFVNSVLLSKPRNVLVCEVRHHQAKLRLLTLTSCKSVTQSG